MILEGLLKSPNPTPPAPPIPSRNIPAPTRHRTPNSQSQQPTGHRAPVLAIRWNCWVSVPCSYYTLSLSRRAHIHWSNMPNTHSFLSHYYFNRNAMRMIWFSSYLPFQLKSSHWGSISQKQYLAIANMLSKGPHLSCNPSSHSLWESSLSQKSHKIKVHEFHNYHSNRIFFPLYLFMSFICTWVQNHVFRSIVGVTIRIFGSDAALADAVCFNSVVDAPLRWPDLPHDAAGDLHVDQISPLLCLSVDQAHPQPPPPHKCRVVSVVDHLLILVPSTFRH